MKSKILFTIGPASIDQNVFSKLASRSGGVRINSAYGDINDHKKLIRFIRKNSNIPIVLDVKGPELRIALAKPLEIKSEELFELYFVGANSFSYNFSSEAKKGDDVLFDDGKLRAEIISLDNKKVTLRAKNSHMLKSEKNAHIPKRKLSIPALSKKDLGELKLANEFKIEYIALSFTRDASDIKNLRKLIAPEIAVIAKIENQDGLNNINEIINEADGVMVARGDLALDITQEKVPLAQKEIIRKCNNKGKLAITATQVLETMIANSYPTRAEISDIANAILDGSDVIMLSGETAIGKFPVQAVETVARVSKEIENRVVSNVNQNVYEGISDAISKSIYTLTEIMPLNAIVSLTRSGYTARTISRFRVRTKIIAVTSNEIVKKQLGLYFGVHAVYIPKFPEAKIISSLAKFLYSQKMLKKGDVVLFTAGMRTKEKYASNLIEVHKLDELLR
ncbi:MAG: pyruvate kinase [Candidatus Micrarchaeota archaeon]